MTASAGPANKNGDGGGFEAFTSPGIQSNSSMTYDANMNINGLNASNSIENSATTITSTPSHGLSDILNASDAELQEKINAILQDPNFPAVLLRMDQLLRGGGSWQ
ncbi:hypothetical protein EC991_009172 [Linnemannia zychae]|nr:hypothetical protein EC991_009172 [Linnemannia zychae]